MLLYLGFLSTLIMFGVTVDDPNPFWAILNGGHALLCAALLVARES